jgi:hypothetical protein
MTKKKPISWGLPRAMMQDEPISRGLWLLGGNAVSSASGQRFAALGYKHIY